MTVMGMVVSPLGWRVNTSSEKQGRMDSSAGSIYGTCAEAPAPFPGKPRALLVLFLPISPTTFDPQGTSYFTQAYPTFCFVLFFAVFSACMPLPLGLLALTVELITSAQSSHSTLFIRQV